MTPKARALFERARTAGTAGRWDEAMRASAELIAAAPDDVRAVRMRALVLTQTGHADALAAWERVLALAPGDAEAHFQLGNAAGDRGDFAAAIAHLEAARATLPSHPLLLNNLGLALEASGGLDDAIHRFREALDAEPRAAAAIAPSLARVLSRVGRDDEAIVAYRAALNADRAAAGVWHDFVRLLLARRRLDEADSVLTQAHAALPDDTLVLCLLAASRQRRGDWSEVAALRERLLAHVGSGHWTGTASGYDFATLCDDPALQRRVAERYAASEVQGAVVIPPAPRADRSARLRLGFVSSDYREHPVARLVVALFERLDRGAFELVAYSTGASQDPVGARVAASVDRFAPLPRRDPDAAARRVRDDAIDVLFDLNGFSGGEALRMFAQRPAPLQVNFLGYTGTLGAQAYDAIVADAYCIPPGAERDYVEQPLRVEPCYLPSDPARVAGAAVTRADYDLADDAVVLYAGGALYKVGTELIDAWLAILRDVPAAALWLRDPGAAARARIEAYAAAHGVAPARLRFAPDEPVARYLARFAVADLMIDTTPFGSHTTVNDALFMGLPVVTLAGRSFAARASGSQLHAIGRPELATRSLADYVDLARQLAGDRARLTDLRASLRDVRAAPLFAADDYAARFADAITQAWRARCR